MATDQSGQPTSTIVKELFADLSRLIQGELALVKNELRENATKLGSGAGMFGGAAVLGLFAGQFVLLAVVFGLVRLGLPAWGAALLVGVLLGMGAAVLALSGKKKVSTAHIAPAEAVAQIRNDVQTIRSDVSHMGGN